MKPEKPVKQNKVNAVSTISTTLKNAKSVALVDYTGMDMKSQQGLMRKLKDANSQMVVAKNTLIKIAGKESALPEELLTDTLLSGQTALVVANADPIEPLQIIAKFMADNEKPKWKAGVVEGLFQTADNLNRISKLPAKSELISQVVGGISAPLYGLVGTLNGNIMKLVYILQAKATQS